MKKILFLYDHKYPDLWRDGLWAALELLSKDFEIEKYNINGKEIPSQARGGGADFILGWGGFNSPVDKYMQVICDPVPKGLCLAGNGFPLDWPTYDVIFYETEWTKQWFVKSAKIRPPFLIHAFGYNSQIYKPTNTNKIIDHLTVGAFAKWKRQERILQKQGIRMAIGEIQKDNLSESMGIIGPLLIDGVIVSDMTSPDTLATLYNASRNVFIPADVYGGGERACLEAQACGCHLELAEDNPKLQELVGKKWDEVYYKDKLKEGIELCLNKFK